MHKSIIVVKSEEELNKIEIFLRSKKYNKIGFIREGKNNFPSKLSISHKHKHWLILFNYFHNDSNCKSLNELMAHFVLYTLGNSNEIQKTR